MACKKDVKFAIRFKNKLKPGFKISGPFKEKADHDYYIVGLKLMAASEYTECFDLGIPCRSEDNPPDDNWVCIDGTWHYCPGEESSSGEYEGNYLNLMEKHVKVMEENEHH